MSTYYYANINCKHARNIDIAKRKTLNDNDIHTYISIKEHFRNVCVRSLVCLICCFIGLIFFASCHRDTLNMGTATLLQIELTHKKTAEDIMDKGAIVDFTAEVSVISEKGNTKYTCFFNDPYNSGVYTIDNKHSDMVFAPMNIPFHVEVETIVNGRKLHGSSEMLVIEYEPMTISIELYGGSLRIYTRTPREEDLSGTLAKVGGAIYELQEEQIATTAGVICAPYSACESYNEENFTIENISALNGYCTDNRAFGVNDGIDGHSASYLPFEVRLNGLSPQTRYRIRAYAVIDGMFLYGQIVDFVTTKGSTSLLTLSATNVTKNSAQINAEIVSGGGYVIERGFITSRTKYLENPQTFISNDNGDFFSSSISDLAPCTRVFYKAYVKTTDGIYYGEIASFSTYDVIVDARDGNEYRYVSVGTQKWLSENMRYLPYVMNVTSGSEDDGQENSSNYYVYGYSGTSVPEAKTYMLTQPIEEVSAGTNSYTTFGVLYNYNAAKTACPNGWRLPTDGEWTQLEIFLQNNGFNSNGAIDCDLNRQTNNFTAKSLAATSLWCQSEYEYSVGKRLDMNDITGISLLPGGYRSYAGGFYGLSKDAYFWSSTENAENAIGRGVGYANNGLNRSDYESYEGLSVRCVKDN